MTKNRAKLEAPCNLKGERGAQNSLDWEPGWGLESTPLPIASLVTLDNSQPQKAKDWVIHGATPQFLSNVQISPPSFLNSLDSLLLSHSPHCCPHKLAFAHSTFVQAVPSLWNALPSPTFQCSNPTLPSRANPKDSIKFFWILSVWNNLLQLL